MMVRRLTAVAILGAMVMGCASPPSRFYTLTGNLPTAEQSRDIAVSVGPVAIPSEVDRPQIVVNEGPYRVRLDETRRWAAPLQDAISGVLVANLSALLGTTRVTRFPATAATDADYRVAIEVQTFESVPDSAANLVAVWRIGRTDGDTMVTGRTSVREPISGADYDALAAAHNRALETLSRDIADALKDLDRR
ncbi:membrane integrity-associated transporter subunit PqiC [Thiocapsa sp.]|uniref:PqiC family protein n=1 Tax=Thiocapsa sp. TaxID=2024551 RepID=UPI003593073B